MTLDATCDPPTPNTGRKTCNCRGAHHISFNNQADSPACLASLSAPTNCSTDAQCRDINRMYICRESKCICPYDTRTNPHACDEAESKMKSGVQSFFDKLSGKQIVILTLVGSVIAIPSFVIILWSLFHFEGFISVPTPCGNCIVGQQRQDSQQEGGRKCCPCFRSGDDEITNESTNEQSSLLENEANGEQPPNNEENGDNTITSQQQIPFLQRITACPCFRCLQGASSPLNVISNVTNGDSGLLNDLSGSLDNVISEGSGGGVDNLASSLNSEVSGESSPINIPNVTNDNTIQMSTASNDEHGETTTSI